MAKFSTQPIKLGTLLYTLQRTEHIRIVQVRGRTDVIETVENFDKYFSSKHGADDLRGNDILGIKAQDDMITIFI